MKIQIASNLHLESWPDYLPDPATFRSVRTRDVLILAGDIGQRHDARIFVMCELPISPVIYVPGNHEYHTTHPRSTIDREWRTAAADCAGLHYLVAEGVTIDGVRFWGAPWYSDLWGTTDPRTRAAVQNRVNDFRRRYDGGGEWTLSRHIDQHTQQTDRLLAQAGEVDVVITHWPPTRAAIHPRFEGDSLNPYFYNDGEDLVRAIGAKLWISGHAHECFDYTVGSTRVIGNPAGYPDKRPVSPLFRPDKVIEV